MKDEIVFVVIGPARAGKTSFSEFLGRYAQLKACGTSRVVYDIIAAARGCSVEDLYKIPKEEIRPCLIKTADYICDIYPDALSKRLLIDGFRIIDGVRREEELVALNHNPDYEIYTIYVHRNDGTVKDNFNISEEYADYHIHNDGNLDDLDKQACDFFHAGFQHIIEKKQFNREILPWKRG